MPNRTQNLKCSEKCKRGCPTVPIAGPFKHFMTWNGPIADCPLERHEAPKAAVPHAAQFQTVWRWAVFCQSGLRWKLRKADIFSTEEGWQQPPSELTFAAHWGADKSGRSFKRRTPAPSGPLPDCLLFRLGRWQSRPAGPDPKAEAL